MRTYPTPYRAKMTTNLSSSTCLPQHWNLALYGSPRVPQTSLGAGRALTPQTHHLSNLPSPTAPTPTPPSRHPGQRPGAAPDALLSLVSPPHLPTCVTFTRPTPWVPLLPSVLDTVLFQVPRSGTSIPSLRQPMTGRSRPQTFKAPLPGLGCQVLCQVAASQVRYLHSGGQLSPVQAVLCHQE